MAAPEPNGDGIARLFAAIEGLATQLAQLTHQVTQQGTQLALQGTHLTQLTQQVTLQGTQLALQGTQLTQLTQQVTLQGTQLGTQLTQQVTRLDSRMATLDGQMGVLGAQMQALEVHGQTTQLSGGGGSSGSSSSSGSGGGGSGTSSPKSAALRKLFADSRLRSPPITLTEGSTRTLPPELQARLWAHRLRTEPRLSECEYAALDLNQSTVLPNPKKGLSLFVATSDDAEVVAAVHAMRGSVTTHAGCVAWRVNTLPVEFVLTLDRVQERSGDQQPIVWHATLSPSAAMTFDAFLAAFRVWGGSATVCNFRGRGSVREGESEDEGEAEAQAEAQVEAGAEAEAEAGAEAEAEAEAQAEVRKRMSTFSENSAPYALVKLAAHAAAQEQPAWGNLDSSNE
jgi:hypothetical protein